jgi:hypothetical protein
MVEGLRKLRQLPVCKAHQTIVRSTHLTQWHKLEAFEKLCRESTGAAAMG